MPDLLWPGDERAGDAFSDVAVLRAMLEVEEAWLQALVSAGVAPESAARPLSPLATEIGVLAAEDSGNPVVPLLSEVRRALGEGETAHWLHRGLTSQDVVDTALVLLCQAATRDVVGALDEQVSALAALARRHRDDVMPGRTLTQHAVPITFGLKAANWLQGILDARDDVRALQFPLQIGGAAGTLAAVTEIAGDADAARFLVADVARRLSLENAVPWHTSRAVLTRYADALVRATDAMGHIANDVLVAARPEIAELAEPHKHGRGGSSTMPQKQNPVLSVLVRRAALAAPGLAAQLHLAAASMVDERADGAWHLEWSTLATLSRRTLVAASQTTEVVEGLRVDTGRMAANAKHHADALLAEWRSIDPGAGADPRDYLGATQQFIDEILERSEQHP